MGQVKQLGMKKWHILPFDRTAAGKFAAEAGIPPLLAVLLQTRGISHPQQAEAVLSESTEFSNPFLMPDMKKATERIGRALDGFEKIAVYGDYDADGITASAMMYSYLESCGGNVIYYIPDREREGYGLNRNAVDALHAQDVQLILTVDNGISSIPEVDYANSLGMDTVITDHHRPGAELPKAAAVVDAWRKDSACPYRDYSGAGVVFKLLTALEGPELGVEPLLDNYADLAAIGTIGDVVPLTGENRMLVQAGLKHISRTDRAGLKALLEQSGMEGQSLTATRVAFTIVPRINATGRMGSADCAVRLLTTDEPDEAGNLAAEVCEANGTRRSVESKVLAEAMKMLSENPSLQLDRVIVVAGEGWHHGVIGIVAAQITDKFGKPCIVFSYSGDDARGSGRSIEGFSLFDAVSSCKDLLLRFGGHPMAAGMSLRTENIEKFRKQINQYAASLPQSMPVPVLQIDCILKPEKLSVAIPQSLQALEPYGTGNPFPVFGLMDMTIGDITPVGGGKHLRITARHGNASIQCMKFGTTLEDFPYRVGDQADLAVTLEERTFNGRETLSTVIREMRLAGQDEDALFSGRALYERFRRGEVLSEEENRKLLPNRNDCAVIYRALRSAANCGGTEEDFYCRLPRGTGFAKFLVILDVFSERGLISRTKNDMGFRIQVLPPKGKVRLEDSPILAPFYHSEKAGDEHGMASADI